MFLGTFPANKFLNKRQKKQILKNVIRKVVNGTFTWSNLKF